MRNAWMAVSCLLVLTLEILPTPAQAASPERDMLLCYLDGKKNSLGSVVIIDGKSYRCTAVLAERGVPGTAWVQIRMAQAIVAE